MVYTRRHGEKSPDLRASAGANAFTIEAKVRAKLATALVVSSSSGRRVVSVVIPTQLSWGEAL